MTIKRKYSSPKIDIHKIDQEICLVMETKVPSDPDLPDWVPTSGSAPEYQGTLKSESPFGGTSPDYENM